MLMTQHDRKVGGSRSDSNDAA